MRSLENRLKKLERKIMGASDNQNVVVLFINVGETEEQARVQHLIENPGISLESSSLIMVRFV